MNVLIDESTLTRIANAIREALSNENKMKMSEVATKIEEIVAARDSFKEQYNYYWKESYDGKHTIIDAIVDNGGDDMKISTATTFEMLADKISTVASRNYNAGVTDTKVGTATAEDVLAGKTFTNANGVGLVGTMTNNEAKTVSLNCSENYTIPKGYHDGNGIVKANTLSSQTIGTATSADILEGKTAWVGGTKHTGTKKDCPNGTKWGSSYSISGGIVNAICNANGRWVIGQNARISYSDDGKTWNNSGVSTETVKCVCNANDIWLATSTYNGLWYSTDGKTWSKVCTEKFNKVYNANGLWVALSSANKGLWYSNDGITWNQSNVTNGYFYSIYYSNNLWVVGGNNVKGLWYSTDGKTWNQSNVVNEEIKTICCFNGVWVAGSTKTNHTSGLWYSNDGITWTIIDNGIIVQSLCKANGILVAGSYGKGLWYSNDGITWNQSNVKSYQFTVIYNANGIWIAGGYSCGLWYSTDGQEWNRSDNTVNTIQDIHNANGLWIASTDNGAVLYSLSSAI
ncbi:MAG: hypothetical protein IKJ01_00155 [Lachnospiraceae bacterium]|nr:hypothetical protein [Lachnospiraceae bacterium]